MSFNRAAFLGLLAFLPLISFPTLPDPWTGAKWAFLSVIVSALAIFRPRELRATHFSISIGILLVFAIALSSFGEAMPFPWQSSVFELVCFWLLLHLFPRINRLSFDRQASFVLAIVWAIFFFRFIEALIAERRFSFHHVGGSFGHVNMAAEFCVLLLGFLTSTRLRIFQQPFANQLLQGFILGTASMFISLTASRSALIALLLVVICALSQHWRKRKTIPVAILVGSFCGLLLLNSFQAGGFEAIANGKESSTSERSKLYEGTLKLVSETPFGLGVGQFEFGATPWLKETGALKSSEIFKSPHSEPLRFLSEMGWISAILSIPLFFFFVRRFKFRKMRSGLPFWLALGAQALFQFPLEVPTSLLLIVLGVTRLTPFRRNPVHPRVSIGPSVAIGSIALVFATVHGYANALPVLGRPERLRLACNLDPYNWRTCEEAMKHADTLREYERAREIAWKQMRLRPWNFSVLRSWSVLEAHAGNWEKSCEIGERYLSFFPDQIADFEYCNFTYIDDLALMKSYLEWLKNQLQ